MPERRADLFARPPVPEFDEPCRTVVAGGKGVPVGTEGEVGDGEAQFASVALAKLSQRHQEGERETGNHFIGEKSVGFTKIESTLTTARPP